jgi:AraC-like DNA-binding protein
MDRIFNLVEIDNGLVLGRTEESIRDPYIFNTRMKGLSIQFHFVLSGPVVFSILKGTYKLGMNENESLFFFNPKNIIPINVSIQPGMKMLSILFSLDALHDIIDDESIDFTFLNPKNVKKKLYEKRNLSIQESLIIKEIFNKKINNKFDKLFVKAKIMEFLSYYFNQNDEEINKCSSLKDEKVVEKIKKAKQIMIDHINEPPTVEELAEMVDLPINVFKKSFKAFYGSPVYKYLLNYKLDLARQLLLSRQYSVKEIAYQMGYSAPTHFVVAFKNKFGVTPKKYIKNQ